MRFDSLAAASIILVLALGMGVGWGAAAVKGGNASPQTSTATVTTSNSSAAPYKLTLFEIMAVPWNSSVMQPKFYVLGDNGLESSANISVPAHRLIELTIVSYDTPTPGVSADDAIVRGTVGGTMEFYNGTVATGFSNETMGQMMTLGKNVSSVPVGSVAHTFSVPGLNVNIPVVGGSTEVAYLYFNGTGTFQWVCLTPCGFGPNGADGAMSTPGWMTGTLTVY